MPWTGTAADSTTDIRDMQALLVAEASQVSQCINIDYIPESLFLLAKHHAEITAAKDV